MKLKINLIVKGVFGVFLSVIGTFIASPAWTMARSPVNGEGQPSPGGGAGLFLPMILVFVIFYFLLIRPQSKQQKKHREMLGHVKKDDQVITNSGIHGQVVGLTDNVITLEIANNVRIKIEKTAISQVKNLAAVQQKT